MLKIPIIRPRSIFGPKPLQKTHKNGKLTKQANFEILQKNMPREVFDEELKTSHGFEIEHR